MLIYHRSQCSGSAISDCPVRSKKARFNFIIWLKKQAIYQLIDDEDANTWCTPTVLDVILDFTGGTAIVDAAMIAAARLRPLLKDSDSSPRRHKSAIQIREGIGETDQVE